MLEMIFFLLLISRFYVFKKKQVKSIFIRKGDDKFQFQYSFDIVKSHAIFEMLVQIYICDH